MNTQFSPEAASKIFSAGLKGDIPMTLAERLYHSMHQAYVATRSEGQYDFFETPHRDIMIEVIKQLNDTPCLFIRHNQCPFEVSYDGRADYVIFEDFSAIGYPDGDPLDGTFALDRDDHDYTFEDLPGQSEEIDIICASPGFTQKFGDLSTWLQKHQNTLQERKGEDWERGPLDALGDECYDLVDPLITQEDIAGERSWGVDEEAKVEKTMDLILAATLQTNEAIQVSIYSAEDDDAKGYVWIADMQYKEAGFDGLKALINHLVDPSGFIGYEMEYNDGATDRMSGHSKSGVLIFGTEVNVSSYSAHERFEARANLKKTLIESGLNETEVAQMIADANARATAVT